MRKYRKRPVEIEAIKLEATQESILIVEQFIEGNYNVVKNTFDDWKFDEYVDLLKQQGGRKIVTLEGVMFASFGDYIIKGISGEFYPCKPDIFEKTYEEVK